MKYFHFNSTRKVLSEHKNAPQWHCECGCKKSFLLTRLGQQYCLFGIYSDEMRNLPLLKSKMENNEILTIGHSLGLVSVKNRPSKWETDDIIV